MSFCDEAKRTPTGYALCMRHKERANALGVRHGKPFCGYCPFGLYEIAYPVVIKGKTACILYVGNLCPSRETARERIRKSAPQTGADTTALTAFLDDCEAGNDATFLPVAKLLATFIVNTAETMRLPSGGQEHWAVKQALQYLERYYAKDIRVTAMAALCNVHPQYFGRLFKQHTGQSFTTYLTALRMQHAARRLQNGDAVADTAAACGYVDVPYFSRVFRREFGVSPAQYKKQHT